MFTSLCIQESKKGKEDRLVGGGKKRGGEGRKKNSSHQRALLLGDKRFQRDALSHGKLTLSDIFTSPAVSFSPTEFQWRYGKMRVYMHTDLSSTAGDLKRRVTLN